VLSIAVPSWFLVAAPGLEPVVAREIGEGAAIVPGGVRIDAPLAEGLGLARTLRTPARMLLELATGRARSLQDLGDLVASIDWTPFLDPRMPIDVQVNGSRLGRRDVVEKKVVHVLAATLRKGRPGAPLPEQGVFVRVADEVSISLDVGGLLHKRGWRTEQGKAPLRENLAACLLVAAGFTGDCPLLDPFCGSGTIAIEGALMAASRSPFTRDRVFASDAWPCAPRPAGSRSGRHGAIAGSDSSATEIDRARRNATRAGVDISFDVLRIDEITPRGAAGLVVANPPYGERLGKDVRGVYAAFGRVLRERFSDWDVVFLAPDDRLAGHVAGAAPLTTFQNGGLRVGMYVRAAGENAG
jgi:putative N6-adenine-specific DNA methylase